MREIGVDATLLVLKRDESIPAAVREWLSGVPVEYLDERLPRFLRTSWRVPGFYFFSIFHGLYALLLPTRIQPREWDVILSHNSYTTFTAWTLSRLRGIPYCMFVWDPIASVLVRAYPKGGIRFLQPLLLPLVLMQDQTRYTLTVWLVSFSTNRGTDFGGLMAASTLFTLPVVVFFLIVQRRVVSGLTAGAVKG